MSIKAFVQHHFRHFNAAALRDAVEAYEKHLAGGGKMFMTIAGAMSTAELGLSLAEMIRQDKVHAICCTGANLEEDLFNVIAHEQYVRVPNYRELTAAQEKEILDKGLSRVTDTCIPDNAAMDRLRDLVRDRWIAAEKRGESKFPHQYLYDVVLAGELAPMYQIDPNDSWVIAAAQRDLPMFVPGWEDSTLGNSFAAYLMDQTLKDSSCLLDGQAYMVELARWYQQVSRNSSIGFFQIGGGIAGDFPICVVPLLKIDLKKPDTPFWGYFCQISDSTTSYGSYSGAVPNEKITWAKLDVDTPSFIIESDASIVCPLMFAYLLGW